MKRYLLDTNICVFLLRGQYNIPTLMRDVGIDNCYLSEITLAELRYGAYKSNDTEHNLRVIDTMADKMGIVPFSESIDVFAKEKNRLRSMGKTIEDFDLLIASAAIARGYTLVTDNTRHFCNIQGLDYLNWIKR